MADPDLPHRGIAPPGDGLAAVRVAFPQTQDEFEQDARVSFSKLENKWILEEDDGSEWEFDEKHNRWMPSLDEGLLERQRQAYAVEGVDESEPAQPSQQLKQNKKRKKGESSVGSENEPASKHKKGNGSSQGSAERKNTAVYVTSLPLDADVEEVQSVFSKCGVIAEEIDSGKPRIKLYTDEAGNFKGDALVVYFRAESVSLAIQMLDDTDFRFGQSGSFGNMQVKEADRSYKKQQDKPAGGERGTRDQKKIIKKTQKLNNKLADWDDDDPQTLQETSSRFDKVVILKHMFTLKELEEDPAAILDIKEDVRDECSKLGQVTNVVLFDKEADGVASVRFSHAEAALACVRLMNGRMFAGQQVQASIADGSERFKKSDEKKASTSLGDDEDDKEEDEDDNTGVGGTKGGAASRHAHSANGSTAKHNNSHDHQDEESKRLDEFGKWLEQDKQ